jgi:hypothetical protein
MQHVCERLRVWAVREAAGMQRDHAGMNIVTREEIAGVIENELIVVVIVVEERDFDGSRI